MERSEMSDLNTLLGCPFCGKEVEIVYKTGDLGYTPDAVSISCCYARVSQIVDGLRVITRAEGAEQLRKQNAKAVEKAKLELATKWNTRAT